MLVITKNPIQVEEETSFASGRRKKSAGDQQAKKARRKQFGSKVKNALGKFRDAGGLSTVENLLLGTPQPQFDPSQDPSLNQGALTDLNARQDVGAPMSTTTKVLIGVAVAAVLGFIGYSIYKSKKTKVG